MSLANYVKNQIPQAVKNFDLKLKNSAVAFVISENTLIVGFVNSDGKLCRLIEPIDLTLLYRGDLSEIIKKIPLVSGFGESDKRALVEFLSSDDHQSGTPSTDVLPELSKFVKSKTESDYQAKIDMATQETVLIKQKFQNQVDDLVKNINQCRTTIESQKNLVIEAIQKYKHDVYQYIVGAKSIQEKLNRVTEAHQKLQDETKLVNGSLDSLKKISTENISEIQQQLEVTQAELTETRLRTEVTRDSQKKCIRQVLDERELIKARIQQYTSEWVIWAKSREQITEAEKNKLRQEISTVTGNLIKIQQQKESLISEMTSCSTEKEETLKKYKKAEAEIRDELDKTFKIQLSDLVEKQRVAINQKDLEDKSRFAIEREKLQTELAKTQTQLTEVKALLDKNNNSTFQQFIDLDTCKFNFRDYVTTNNNLHRKQKILEKLSSVINTKGGAFGRLSEETQTSVTSRFEKIEAQIEAHIHFMGLKDFSSDPELKKLESKDLKIQNQVSEKFCSGLQAITDYWKINISEFRAQDQESTNIYEDLSGAVRVYVRVAPVSPTSEAGTVKISANPDLKGLVVDCRQIEGIPEKSKRQQSYENFYGVFGPDYSNIDLFTGVFNSQNVLRDSISGDGSIIDTEIIDLTTPTVSPGMYTAFQQISDGYHVAIYGYGVSGSGKTFTLLGSPGGKIPGMIHYALVNLKAVKVIKVVNIFEQYVNRFNPNVGTVTGKIHTLVGKPPGKIDDRYIKKENDSFSKALDSALDLEDFAVDDVNRLVEIIDVYRRQHGRVKKTPNNDNSSRSHLYIIIQVTFESGKIGYLTIVDMAGRESPIELFDTFFKPSFSLQFIIGLPAKNIKKEYLKPEIAEDSVDYPPENLSEILQEGVYINETINHLMYYFNKKTGNYTLPMKQTISKYNPDANFVNRDREYESSGIDPNNNALMIPVLQFLDSLGSNSQDYKPTKFLMTTHIRQDPQFCPQIFDTLDFASKIKSS
jgi:hypothetical protein